MNEQQYNPFEVQTGTFNPFDAEQKRYIDAVADALMERINEHRKKSEKDNIKSPKDKGKEKMYDSICKMFAKIKNEQPLATNNSIIETIVKSDKFKVKRNRIYRILKAREVI